MQWPRGGVSESRWLLVLSSMNFTASTTTGERTHTHTARFTQTRTRWVTKSPLNAAAAVAQIKRTTRAAAEQQSSSSNSFVFVLFSLLVLESFYHNAVVCVHQCVCVCVCVCESVKCFFVEAARLPSLRPRMLSVSVVCVPVCACVREGCGAKFQKQSRKSFLF